MKIYCSSIHYLGNDPQSFPTEDADEESGNISSNDVDKGKTVIKSGMWKSDMNTWVDCIAFDIVKEANKDAGITPQTQAVDFPGMYVALRVGSLEYLCTGNIPVAISNFALTTVHGNQYQTISNDNSRTINSHNIYNSDNRIQAG
jgi:hypothetical protein